MVTQRREITTMLLHSIRGKFTPTGLTTATAVCNENLNISPEAHVLTLEPSWSIHQHVHIVNIPILESTHWNIHMKLPPVSCVQFLKELKHTDSHSSAPWWPWRHRVLVFFAWTSCSGVVLSFSTLCLEFKSLQWFLVVGLSEPTWASIRAYSRPVASHQQELLFFHSSEGCEFLEVQDQDPGSFSVFWGLLPGSWVDLFKESF